MSSSEDCDIVRFALTGSTDSLEAVDKAAEERDFLVSLIFSEDLMK